MSHRILVVSNFYPPIIYGGYEIACAQVVEGLRDSGFEVDVLTSNHRSEECGQENGVHRELLCSFGKPIHQLPFLERSRRLLAFEFGNQRRFREAVKQFHPDLIYFWNLGGTSRSLLALAKQQGWNHGIFLFDCSLTDSSSDLWERHAGQQVSRLPNRIARLVLRRFARALSIESPTNIRQPDFCHYPTDYILKHHAQFGFHPVEWVKTTWGVDENTFIPSVNPKVLRLLFIGQVAEHKGVHVAIESLGRLVSSGEFPEVSLTIAGKSLQNDYQTKLERLIATLNLTDRVNFIGPVGRGDLPSLYNHHSVLIFPSIWEEPMGIVILEAMACGLAIVSSGSGGARELTSPDVDGLFFESGSAEDCARQIARLIKSPRMMENLGENARKTVLERFRFSSLISGIAGDIAARCIT